MVLIGIFPLLLTVAMAAEFPAIAMDKGSPASQKATVPLVTEYDTAVTALVIEDVMTDLEGVMVDSKEWWPADFGNYGPFFIRLAWHCAGTYRNTDGKGGCGGGRQRFDPEATWADNANLDKARALLWPVKEKYGDGLSWGDLFILAGTTAIRSMGGPIEPPCVGRIDDIDGSASLALGPSEEQEHSAPCPNEGNCQVPLGSTTVGLIYLNPEGPVEEDADGALAPNPDPALTAVTIKDAFNRMGMNVEETLALIGGGHAFGKCHGPCETAPCGTGIGADTFTSGFEGAWTSNPTAWDNEYFKMLADNVGSWEKHMGPGGHWQWRIQSATGANANIMMLTSDVALLADPEFKTIVDRWAADIEPLNTAFAAAWWKLTHSGGRWSDNRKCLGGTTTDGMRDDDTADGTSGTSNDGTGDAGSGDDETKVSSTRDNTLSFSGLFLVIGVASVIMG